MTPVVIALASNARYFQRLYCAVASALGHMAAGSVVDVHVLDGGISQSFRDTLSRLAESFNRSAWDLCRWMTPFFVARPLDRTSRTWLIAGFCCHICLTCLASLTSALTCRCSATYPNSLILSCPWQDSCSGSRFGNVVTRGRRNCC